MGIRTLVACSTITAVVGIGATDARAQAQTTDETPWSAEVAIGIDPSINGLVNSGAIGELQGLATAILPNCASRPVAQPSAASPAMASRTRSMAASRASGSAKLGLSAMHSSSSHRVNWVPSSSRSSSASGPWAISRWLT